MAIVLTLPPNVRDRAPNSRKTNKAPSGVASYTHAVITHALADLRPQHQLSFRSEPLPAAQDMQWVSI